MLLLFFISFGLIYHVRIFILKQNCLIINMLQNGSALGIHRFYHLDIPIKHQHLTDTMILVNMGRLFDIVHSPI